MTFRYTLFFYKSPCFLTNWRPLICRVYSPVVFGKKTDPEGDYIRKYLPQLAKYPAKYIYTPWEAPLSIQKAAGCIIGRL
jgi:deoxyribodipyrimidine photolyase